MEESSEEWHDARGNLTREGSAYSSIMSDDSFTVAKKGPENAGGHDTVPDREMVQPTATTHPSSSTTDTSSAAAAPAGLNGAQGKQSVSSPAPEAVAAAAHDDADVDAQLLEMEAEAAQLSDPALEAELQQFEAEMAPLNQQLDLLQQQLAEAATMDKEGAAQLQMLHSKLSSPAALRRQQGATAAGAVPARTTSSAAGPAPGAGKGTPPAAAAAAAAGAGPVADTPEPGATPYLTPMTLSPATPSGSSMPALSGGPLLGGVKAPAAAAGAGGGAAPEPPPALVQQLQQPVQEQGSPPLLTSNSPSPAAAAAGLGGFPPPGPSHSRNPSGLSFGSLASEPQLEALGPPSRSSSGQELSTLGAAAAAAAAGEEEEGQSGFRAAKDDDDDDSEGGTPLSSMGAAAAASTAQDAGLPDPSVSAFSNAGPAPQQQQQQQQVASSSSPRLGPARSSSAAAPLPVSPSAMAAVAPAPLAPPRSDLDLRRLSSSPEGSGGGASLELGDAWAAWAAHRRHVFVLTSAGKPVYSLHGDEGALAGFMAIIQAVVSVVADQGDGIRSLAVGPTQLVVALRGHLYLVGVSSRGEPPAALRQQLHLLHQAILMVITNGVEKVLTRTPGYDVRQLLAGSTPALTALVSSFSSSSGWLLNAVEPAPGLSGAERAAAAAALQTAVSRGGALYGVLLAGRGVVAVDCGRAVPLHPADLLLLANFANGNAALRQAESFTPLCLPNFQPGAMLHAYVGCLEPAAGIFLLLLGASPGAFHSLAAQRVLLEADLLAAGTLLRLRDAAAAADGGRPSIPALPPPAGGLPGRTPLWHYLVHWPGQHQHITAAWPSDLLAGQAVQEEVLRQYSRLYCTAHAPVLTTQPAAANTGIGNGSGSSSGAGGSNSGGGAAEPSLASSILGLPGSMGSSGGASAMAAAATAASYVLPYAPPRPSRVVWAATRRWVGVASIDKEVEVYCVMDPLTDADTAGRVVEVIRKHYSDKAVQAGLLVPAWNQ